MARSSIARTAKGVAAVVMAAAGGGALGAALGRRQVDGERDAEETPLTAAPANGSAPELDGPAEAAAPDLVASPPMAVGVDLPVPEVESVQPPAEEHVPASSDPPVFVAAAAVEARAVWSEPVPDGSAFVAAAAVAAAAPTPRAAPASLIGTDEDRELRVEVAVHRLRDIDPELSAAEVLLPRQRTGFLGAAGALLVLLGLAPILTLRVLATIVTAVYAGSLLFRFQLLSRSRRVTDELRIDDAEALALRDDELPLYSILCPAFGEPSVVERLLGALEDLDYPRSKLEVLLLMEEDDEATIEAALAALAEGGRAHVKPVLVPRADPRTKPKALNYGLELAIGDILTIYDAEDRPEPLQLRKAVIGLDRAGPRTACLQAKLGYYNPDQNVITRWFTVEYDMWFTQFLPGLTDLDAPLPLGGTSNHFRTDVLRSLGGWDPFNVTEDADLGVRLHRAGYRTGVLDAVTMEEANSDFVNWVRQRSRWYKGYLQTWLVHMRRPRELRDELGTGGFVRFNLFVGGTPALALLNPLMWTLVALWFIGRPHLLEQAFPPIVYHFALLSWIAGNFVFLYAFLLVARDHADSDRMVLVCLLIPFYWVMMSLAAVKALVSLVGDPSYWEKTVHGLDVARRGTAGVDLEERSLA